MKQRIAVFGLVLLAIGAALVFGRQWSSTSETTLIKVEPVTKQPVELSADRAAPPPAAEAATANTTPTTTVAAPGGTFRGRVIDAVTRQPVQEFEVGLAEVFHDRILGKQVAAQTFQPTDGRFIWQQAPVGNWYATVVARRYQRFRVENISIAAGKATREVVIPLRHGRTLTGRVFDQSSGVGVGNAYLSLADPNSLRAQIGDPNAAAHSKDDGTFVLDGVPDGEAVVSVSAKGRAPREVPVIVNEDTPPLEIGLGTGGKVAGMVIAPDGTPLSGHVMLTGVELHGNRSDETGTFSFPHVAAGRHRLIAMTPAGGASLEFELAENEFREGIVLKVGEGRIVRGVVKGLRPEQLEQSHISARSESNRAFFSATPDGQGAYVIRGVPSGRVHVTASVKMSGHVEKIVDVPADKDVVLDIVFPPGVRLSGRVTQGAKPLADKFVWVRSPDGKQEMSYHGSTAQDGGYQIEGVVPGEYRVAVHEGTSRIVSIASDAVVNFDLPLVQIGGRIVEDGGTVPIPGVGVHVIGIEPQTDVVRSYKETDDLGEFRLIGIEPGEVLLTVYKPGYEMQREKISYSSPITNKKIALRRSAGVEVRVQSASEDTQIRQLFVSERMPDSDYGIALSCPVDREGIGYLPSALAGSTLKIQPSGSQPIVIEKWNGQSLDLKF
jgi:hypothetical protein